MALLKLFTEHPASVGESYFAHMGRALYFSGRMALGAIACCIHALLPFLFVRTGSRTIAELHDCMVVNRSVATPHSTAVPGQLPRSA